MSPTKVLIDTDAGDDIDDLIAIWFALLRPELDIRGITTATYPSDKRARLIKRLMRFLNRNDIPVAGGMAYPLAPLTGEALKNQLNPAIKLNHYCFAEPEDPRDTPDATDAVDLMIRTIEAHPGELTLLCIAPLTNVATALRRKPEIAAKIKAIIMMGGEIAQLRCEHNVTFDYLASDIVFSSGIPIMMGTWSITRQFTIMPDDVQRLRSTTGELGVTMGRAIDAWHKIQGWKPGPVMYDIFPMIHAFDPSYYTLEKTSLKIETRGDYTRGMTVYAPGGADVQVTTGIRADAVRELFWRTVAGKV